MLRLTAAVALAVCTSAHRFLAADSGAFTAGATVIVLTGLPGDLESERAYEDGLKRLLEALSSPSARPREVLLLVDAPERVTPPAGLPVRVMGNARSVLAGLAPAPSAPASPWVVIAWGHGGAQGRDPVFHVRGPRLVPSDFAALAARAGPGPSRWILSFRGSGAFARALRAEGREILSSENEIAFTSDPVGMTLVVKRLRERPAVGFTELAEDAGRATAAWYAEQHLARTEEPTLWRGQEPPRALTPEPRTVGPERAAAPPATGGMPDPAARSAEAATTTAASSDWQGITAVEARRFPGASAVVLRRHLGYTLGDDPVLSQEVDQFVEVLTEEGESHADLDVAYWPPQERFTLLDAEMRHPDGRLERIDADAVREAAPQDDGEYRSAARKVLSLPGARPGAILRLHYRTDWKHYPLPHVPLEIPLASELPALDTRVEVRVPAKSSFHYAFTHGARQEPRTDPSPFGVSYSWSFAETPALPEEALMPPDRVPRLVVSTFPDWAAYGAWYQRLIQEADQITPEIRTRADELTRGARTEMEKVVALYNYVTSLRYVAIPLGVNSHRPHAAAHVLRNRYGDCKDKANLFNTLLRAEGITAHLVLAPRFAQAYDEVPGIGFNHAISRLQVGGQTYWADTTDPFCRFGLLPPGDPGRKVLVIDGSTALTTLPLAAPAAHRLALEGTVELPAGPSGEAAASRLEVTATGIADYALRLAARSGLRSAPVLGHELEPTAGLFEMTEQAHTPVAALDQAFAWKAGGRWAGLVSVLPDGRRLLRAPFWVPGEWKSAMHARATGLFLNQGYPLTLDESWQMVLPPGAGEVALPAAQAAEDGALRFRAEWTRGASGRIQARLHVELLEAELGGKETGAFQARLRALWGAAATGATFTLPSGSTGR